MSFPHLFIISLQDTLKPSVLWVTSFLFASVCVYCSHLVGVWWTWILRVLLSHSGLKNFESSLERIGSSLYFVFLVVVAKTLMMILFFVSSAMVTYYLFLMVYSIIVGFFDCFIKKFLQKYYPHTTLKNFPFLLLWLLLKFVAITIHTKEEYRMNTEQHN